MLDQKIQWDCIFILCQLDTICNFEYGIRCLHFKETLTNQNTPIKMGRFSKSLMSSDNLRVVDILLTLNLLLKCLFLSKYCQKHLHRKGVLLLTVIGSLLICMCVPCLLGFPSGSAVKNLPAEQQLQETRVRSLGWEDPLEEGMTTHTSIIAWRIPWIEKRGRLQSTGHKELDTTGVTWHAYTMPTTFIPIIRFWDCESLHELPGDSERQWNLWFKAKSPHFYKSI